MVLGWDSAGEIYVASFCIRKTRLNTGDLRETSLHISPWINSYSTQSGSKAIFFILTNMIPCWHWHNTDLMSTKCCFYYWALASAYVKIWGNPLLKKKMLEALCGLVCRLGNKMIHPVNISQYIIYVHRALYIFMKFSPTEVRWVQSVRVLSPNVPQCPPVSPSVPQCPPVSPSVLILTSLFAPELVTTPTALSSEKPWKFFKETPDCWALLTAWCCREMRWLEVLKQTGDQLVSGPAMLQTRIYIYF